MKLSDFTTDGAADVLVTIAPLIDNIVQDADLIGTINSGIIMTAGGVSGQIAGLISKILSCIPALLKNDAHRKDIYGILAAINQTTPEEIGKQNIVKTLAQVKEAVNDEALVSFFTSFAPQEKTAQSVQSVMPPA